MRYKKQYLQSAARKNRFTDNQYDQMINLLKSAVISKTNYHVVIKLPDGGASTLRTLLSKWQKNSKTIDKNAQNGFEINSNDTKLTYKCGSTSGYKTRVANIYGYLLDTLGMGNIVEYDAENPNRVRVEDGTQFNLAYVFNAPDSETDVQNPGAGGSGATSPNPSSEGHNAGNPYQGGGASGSGNYDNHSSQSDTNSNASGTDTTEPSFFESNKTMIIILVVAVAVAGFIIFRK